MEALRFSSLFVWNIDIYSCFDIYRIVCMLQKKKAQESIFGRGQRF